MDRIRLKDKEFELFIPESDIQAAIAKMAVQIKADVEGKNPLFVGVLNGAFMFVAELMRVPIPLSRSPTPPGGIWPTLPTTAVSSSIQTPSCKV